MKFSILTSRINYFLSSMIKNFIKKNHKCTYCNSPNHKIISKKFFVTKLVRCEKCSFMFRIPTTSVKENNKYYQNKYTGGGQDLFDDKKNMTIDMPSKNETDNFKKFEFKDTDKDYSNYLYILSHIKDYEPKKEGKLFDYGCSWGYGSYQFKKAGYNVSSYEISKTRSDYAKNILNINMIENLDNVLRNSFDICFSAHVLEHLPDPKKFLDFGLKILKQNGVLVIFTPNGSFERKKKDFYNWNKAWGLIHPNLLDERFYMKIFFKQKYFITTKFEKDLYLFKKFMTNNESLCGTIDGDELLIIVKK